MQVVTRANAKSLGLKRYFTSRPCPKGHVEERLVSNGCCVVCGRNKVKNQRKSGGSQHYNHMQRAKRNRRVGGCQHANTMLRNRKRMKYRNRSENWKIASKLRIRLNKAVGRNIKVGSAVRDLGCSIAEFKTYIAAQFKNGMTWDNRGKWHLDHKKPLSSFNLTDREQFLQACHFTNYQPLWAADNIRKGAAL